MFSFVYVHTMKFFNIDSFDVFDNLCESNANTITNLDDIDFFISFSWFCGCQCFLWLVARFFHLHRGVHRYTNLLPDTDLATGLRDTLQIMCRCIHLIWVFGLWFHVLCLIYSIWGIILVPTITIQDHMHSDRRIIITPDIRKITITHMTIIQTMIIIRIMIIIHIHPTTHHIITTRARTHLSTRTLFLISCAPCIQIWYIGLTQDIPTCTLFDSLENRRICLTHDQARPTFIKIHRYNGLLCRRRRQINFSQETFRRIIISLEDHHFQMQTNPHTTMLHSISRKTAHHKII